MIQSIDFEYHGDLVKYMRVKGIHKENVVQITHTCYKVGYDLKHRYTLFYET